MWYLIFFIIFVFIAAFFNSAEVAFVSLQRYRLEHMAATGVKGARLLTGLLDKPQRFYSVVLLGQNFAGIAVGSLGAVLAVRWFDEWGVVAAIVLTTIILLIFAETTPKTIANRHAEKVSLLYARPLKAAEWVLTPFVNVLSWIAGVFARMFGVPTMRRSLISEEEIRTMISVGEEAGVVEEEAAEILHKLFDFGDRPVGKIMVPRLDIIGVEKGIKVSDFLKIYTGSPISRYPVYIGTLDDIVGILSIKEVLMGLAKGWVTRESLIDELVRPAFFVPETKIIKELLVEMREKNHRMAVVVDEYGGTAGIVSLTGLTEEIVGPIGDDLGSNGREYEIINDFTFQIDGAMKIDEVNTAMGLGLPAGDDYETVAGLVLKVMGRIPRQGDRLRYKGLRIMITRMQGRKIEELLITKE